MIFSCKDCNWTGTTLRQAVTHALAPHRVLQWFHRWRGLEYPLRVKGWPQ